MTRTLVDNADRITDLVDILLSLSLANRKSIVDARMTSESVLAGAQADLMPAIKSAQADLDNFFPAGIQMLFQQSAAPSGWKKLTGYNDCALRLTSEGTGSRTDGMAFSACFASGRGLSTTQISMGVNASTLSVGQLAGHSHGVYKSARSRIIQPNNWYQSGSWWGDNVGWTGSNWGHGHGTWNTAHGHSLDLNVNYVDVVLCERT